MEDVLDRLIKIENRASSVMEEGEAEVKKLIEANNEKRRLWDEEVRKDSDAQINKLKEEFNERLNQKLNVMKADTEKQIKELKEHYEKFHTQYVDELFNEMTNVSYE